MSNFRRLAIKYSVAKMTLADRPFTRIVYCIVCLLVLLVAHGEGEAPVNMSMLTDNWYNCTGISVSSMVIASAFIMYTYAMLQNVFKSLCTKSIVLH